MQPIFRCGKPCQWNAADQHLDGAGRAGIGASLQHYNPVIDDMVRERYKLPKTYRLVAQMPFGG
ncbi:hypothetical protein [Suipraeoptans intestinalis]|uniref:hypothetical protein n=1 Tax=Suipraeoptans intestinalis TaxID=2606628 RepID=UPI001F421813|nr:hypothetical protein [Suipraeoptans intestinalis]